MEKIAIDYLLNLNYVRQKNRSHYAADMPGYMEETDEEYVKRIGYPIANLTDGNFSDSDLARLTVITNYGNKVVDSSYQTVYPKLILPKSILLQITRGDKSIKTIKFGEYPCEKTDSNIQQELEQVYNQRNISNLQMYQRSSLISNNKVDTTEKMKVTGKTYTVPLTIIKKREKEFLIKKEFPYDYKSVIQKTANTITSTYQELEYRGERYIRFVNHRKGVPEEPIWIKVSPMEWILEDGVLFSKKSIFNVILENHEDFLNDSSKYHVLKKDGIIKPKKRTAVPSQIKTQNFLDTYFLKDLLQSAYLPKVIKYNTFIELEKIIKDNNYKLISGITEIVLDGPKLSKMEMNKIRRLVLSEIRISYKDELDQISSRYSKYSKDIQDLLKKIVNISSKIPDDAKNYILREVDKILDEYDKDAMELEPKFNKDYIINLGGKDINTIKPFLLSKLEIIIMNLETEDKIINFLERLSNYKKLLSKKDVVLVENVSSIEGKINNIIFMLNQMDNSKKNLFKDKLSGYVDEAIEKESKELEKGVNYEPDLSMKREFDVDKLLDINISNLYDDVTAYYNKVVPFEKLLDILDGGISDGFEMGEVIVSMENLINDLANDKHKDDLKDRWNEIIIKYKNMIKNIIGNNELLKNTKYEKIENNLIGEIQKVLVLIRKYNVLDSFKVKKYNKESLLEQLKESKKIVNSKEKVELTEDDKLKVITSTVIELNNYIMANTNKSEIINEIKTELMNIIDKSITELETKKINNLEEYNKELRKILSDIMGIQLQTNFYFKEVKRYSDYTK